MGKNQQLILEEYQDKTVTIIRVEAAAFDTDPDMGSLPGCIGIYNQPEQGYVCSTCYHHELCRATTATPTATIIVDKN